MPGIADNESKPENDLLLIGLTPQQALWEYSGSWTLVVLLPFAILLGMASLPLAKFWYMPGTETLRRGDLAQIAVGTLGMVLLLSFMGLYIYMKLLGDGATDKQLDMLADAIGNDVKLELENGVHQLRDIDRFASEQPKEQQFRTRLFDFLPEGS